MTNTLYLATNSSVYRSSDGGNSWYPLAAGFPLVRVNSLNLHRGARILRAATYGRGVWDLSVLLTASRLANVSLASTDSGYSLTVNGTNFTANSAIVLSGNPVPTMFQSATQLTAALTSDSISPSTVYYVAVSTPGPGGGLSDPLLVSQGPTIYSNEIQSAAGPGFTASYSPTNYRYRYPREYPPVGLSPGMLTAIYGSQLAAAADTAQPPLPSSFDGVQVLVNGNSAPISYVSPTEVDFIVPWELAGSQATVTVTSGGASSNTVTLPVQATPKIFTTSQQGSGQGQVLIVGTNSIAAPAGVFPGSRPVAKGESIAIYVTGLGAVQNPPPDGAPPSGASPTLVQPIVLIGCGLTVT